MPSCLQLGRVACVNVNDQLFGCVTVLVLLSLLLLLVLLTLDRPYLYVEQIDFSFSCVCPVVDH